MSLYLVPHIEGITFNALEKVPLCMCSCARCVVIHDPHPQRSKSSVIHLGSCTVEVQIFLHQCTSEKHVCRLVITEVRRVQLGMEA